MPLRRLLFALSRCISVALTAVNDRGVETAGLEPATPCLQSRCSPS